MRWSHRIRRWKRVGLYSLLTLTMHRLAVAGTETLPPPKKPTHATVTLAPKTKHPVDGAAATKKQSSGTHLTHSSVHSSASGKSVHGKKTSKRKRGQQAIDSSRTREIQSALIREHYLQGQPSGTWDSASQSAMQRYQADQGWQSKTTPDSRALIKLGLGPSHDHLLNPDSAMTTSASLDSKASGRQSSQENNLSHKQ
jgi:hypothetical protein